MKRFLVSIGLLMLVICFGSWAAGQQEAVAPTMDKIVYLSVGLHDKPEHHGAWAAEFKRITGVDVVLQTVSSKDAAEGMMARFMAGEFPDVVKYGSENLSPLARQEFIIPLDRFIENSPGMKRLKELYPVAFQAHSVDGVVYGIPAMVGQKRGLWVRTDILDKQGLGMPRTLDELVDTMKKIRDNVPTPDGGKMFPYISKTYHSGYISGLSNYFDVSPIPVMRRQGDKEFREGWDSPQLRDYANFIKMLWDERLIDPDHALPQKASATRNKFYAGKGAFLFMWDFRYQEMITELRNNFPEVEIDLVPPIENPKGGVLGVSLEPGYRPFCIMSAAKDPQFVWDNFIEPLYLTTDGHMLLFRGIPNASYKIVNGIMEDNFDESGIHMGMRSPLNPDIEFPYKMAPLNQKAVDIQAKMDGWLSKYGYYCVAEEPTVTVPEYDMVRGDMGDKKNELFWKYVIGEHDFAEMMRQFEAYKKEVDFDSILAKINSQS